MALGIGGNGCRFFYDPLLNISVSQTESIRCFITFVPVMKIGFFKYEGTGNDFLLFDDRENSLNFTTQEINQLCNRHFGIGGDGILILRKQHGDILTMQFFNPDGSRAGFCGNGGRCFALFAHHLGLAGGEVQFVADDGPHQAFISHTDKLSAHVRLKMSDPELYSSGPDGLFLNTGTFHYVKWVDELEKTEVNLEGRLLRYDERFGPAGTNVDFVQRNQHGIELRTYEKGVESETLSCGTGVTASAIAAGMHGMLSPVEVQTRGGKLTVEFTITSGSIQDVWLTGPARRVFSGMIELER